MSSPSDAIQGSDEKSGRGLKRQLQLSWTKQFFLKTNHLILLKLITIIKCIRGFSTWVLISSITKCYQEGKWALYKYWLIIFLGTRCKNSVEVANLLVNLKADWPKSVAFIHNQLLVRIGHWVCPPIYSSRRGHSYFGT